MKYRAKVTNIIDWVKPMLLDKTFVTDANDIYVEVKSELQADSLEDLNNLKEEEKRLKNIIMKEELPFW